MDPAPMAAAISAGKLVFGGSEGCCTTLIYRANCVGGGVAKCPKCQYHYCKYHYPVNNSGAQGGHCCN
ncbi:hypothetical protein HXX76_007213 [Chlamydomonas incerta]|uniref:Uncharacterized protein n=1 Tax=Chlamydomonas incerta TaxID=51695 RepID=A0A835SXV5_CHLIN|nr:hypothetical protein HXX76_007213 [Chlamydomonas incerta]|eukprot:KAG2435128.1 hypothetical protein HXX76_007213 [Chlamydomonas incerta]